MLCRDGCDGKRWSRYATGASSFIITEADTIGLTAEHTVCGRGTSGMDGMVDKIGSVETAPGERHRPPPSGEYASRKKCKGTS